MTDSDDLKGVKLLLEHFYRTGNRWDRKRNLRLREESAPTFEVIGGSSALLDVGTALKISEFTMTQMQSVKGKSSIHTSHLNARFIDAQPDGL